MRVPKSGRGLAMTLGAGVVLTIGIAPLLAQGADHLDAPNLGFLSAGAVKRRPGYQRCLRVPGERSVEDRPRHDDQPRRQCPEHRPVRPFRIERPLHAQRGSKRRRAPRSRVCHDVLGSRRGGRSDLLHRAVQRRQRPDAQAGRHMGTGIDGGGGVGSLKGSGQVFAGERSDPFFFDLIAFRNTVGIDNGSRTFCQAPSDFFIGLNTLAIVIEVPDDQLGGSQIGVWATTSELIGGSWVQQDQMARPAINTVFNHTGADKNAFNVTDPADQPTTAPFRANVIKTLIGPNLVVRPVCNLPDRALGPRRISVLRGRGRRHRRPPAARRADLRHDAAGCLPEWAGAGRRCHRCRARDRHKGCHPE